jgi:hypothetical protein
MRDRFLGEHCCIVCGDSLCELIRILPDSDPTTVSRNWMCIQSPIDAIHCHTQWESLQQRGWTPFQMRSSLHEVRNTISLCPNHECAFKRYDVFIRFMPDVRFPLDILHTLNRIQEKKYILINYLNLKYLRPFHGKAVGLDVKDPHAPLPSLLILHEMRVRGKNPFVTIQPNHPEPFLSKTGSCPESSSMRNRRIRSPSNDPDPQGPHKVVQSLPHNFNYPACLQRRRRILAVKPGLE